MKFRRIITRGLLVIVVIALLAGAGGAYYFMSYLPKTVAPRSFPQTDGTLQMGELNAQVDVYRDQAGIAHIYAATPHDLFFAQGYVHAQERFWQMDAWRHIGSGTLSEMFGEGQVETDAFLRTLGWEQTAEAEWEGLGRDSRDILLAYTEGVNAYLKDHSGDALSLEYAVLKLLSPNYQIVPWTPVNSLTWGKAMAWDLRGNMDEEIERAVLLKTLTMEQVNELYPDYPADHPVIVNTIGSGNGGPQGSSGTTANAIPDEALNQVASNINLLDEVLGPLGDGIGSNSWAVSGSLTDSGNALLANDPHLSIQMPSIWFQVDMHCQPKTDACPYEMAGFSFAGVPGVVIGHNDRIAWGYTNAGPDVMDLYIEKVNPDNPNQYEVNGQWVDFETRSETISVSGGEPVELTVRSTRHGPVVSDTFGPLKDVGDPTDKEFTPFRENAGIDLPENYVIALKWTALTPSTPFEAMWGFNKARNWEEFREAASMFHVPAQNLIYADVDGNIGYQMPGDVPIRAAGDGRLPVQGWTDDYEWTGFIPFEELPYTFNPDEGYIVTANNQTHPNDYPYLVTTDWDYGFRADRIVEMITSATSPIDTATIQKMQSDALDANGPVFVPLLVQSLGSEATADETEALEVLKNWDYQVSADSAGAAIFEVFWRRLLQNTFNDDLPEDYWPEGGSRWNEVMRKLTADSSWWDDITTEDVVESRANILKQSFSEAVVELTKEQGKNAAQWQWGAMHTATFRNTTLGESGVGLIENLFNRGPYPASGGEAVVNATGWSVLDGYEVDWLPSMRMIIDLSDLNASLSVHTTGQSGHAYNRHYDDLTQLWLDNTYYPMWWARDSVEGDAESHLVLVP
jgi:penicillin amidase